MKYSSGELARSPQQVNTGKENNRRGKCVNLKRRDSRTVKKKTDASICSGLNKPTVMSISGLVGKIRICTVD